MFDRFRILLLSVCVAGCGSNQLVAEREQFWSGEIEAFFSQPRNLSEIDPWLRQQGVDASLSKDDLLTEAWTVSLEQVEGGGVVCESWLLRLEVFAEKGGAVDGHSLSRQGACL